MSLTRRCILASAVAATSLLRRSIRGAVAGVRGPTQGVGGRASETARSDPCERPEYAATWGQSRPKTQDVVVYRVARPQHVVLSVDWRRPRSVHSFGVLVHGFGPVIHVGSGSCPRRPRCLPTMMVPNRRSVRWGRGGPAGPRDFVQQSSWDSYGGNALEFLLNPGLGASAERGSAALCADPGLEGAVPVHHDS